MADKSRTAKQHLIDQVVSEFRASGNQDDAFDNLAADRLGVSRTDLHCLNAIENAGGLTAGELATASGLTTGAFRAPRWSIGASTAGKVRAPWYLLPRQFPC